MDYHKKEKEFDFSQYIQDSLLLLGIYDKDIVKYIYLFVKPENFTSEFARLICLHIIKFYSQFNSPPKDYFWEILRKDLNSKNYPKKKRELIFEYCSKLIEIDPNKEYVITNLNDFLKHQNFSAGIIKGASLIQKGKYDEAEKAVLDAFHSTIHRVDLGLDYLNYKGIPEPPPIVCKTLIDPFDSILRGFRRKDYWLWLASTNVGKTWALTYSTSVCLFQGKNVVYYTLGDLGEEWIALRLDMMYNSLGTREQEIQLPHVKRSHTVRSIFKHKDLVVKKRSYIKGLGGKLYIKAAPRGGLTVSRLKADIEMFQAVHGFFPDAVMIDYADKMRSERNYNERRHEHSYVYDGIKDIAMEYNIHMQSASQSNRASIDAKYVSLQHFAEDIGKARPANVIMSLCQTPEELKHNVMRFFCCKNSNERKGWQVISRYLYEIGQFCLGAELLEDDD
jgi:replicative DNA helicase